MKFLSSLLMGERKKGERLPPPSCTTVQPDYRPSQYVWFLMTHASARWAKDFHFREHVLYLKNNHQ